MSETPVNPGDASTTQDATPTNDPVTPPSDSGDFTPADKPADGEANGDEYDTAADPSSGVSQSEFDDFKREVTTRLDSIAEAVGASDTAAGEESDEAVFRSSTGHNPDETEGE